MFIEALKSAIIGIIQGITEWLPVSSTGHMILAEKILQLNVSQEFWDMFKVVIQFASILAVILIYFNKLNPFSSRKSMQEKKETYTLWGKVIVAVLPAAVAGLLLDDLIDGVLSHPYVIAATLIIYGIAFIIIEKSRRVSKIEALSDLTYKRAVLIGLFQVLALVPGTSRSGATILGAIILGCSRFVGTEFSFFMAVPVMLGASGLKIVKFVLEGAVFTSVELVVMATGFIVSFVVSVWAIKFLIGYIKKHDFTSFGIYRIILGVVVIAAQMLGYL